MALLTRSADLRQAAAHLDHRRHPHLERSRRRQSGARSASDCWTSLGLQGKRLGVEYDTHGLTAANGQRLDAALDGFARLIDASDSRPAPARW